MTRLQIVFGIVCCFALLQQQSRGQQAAPSYQLHSGDQLTISYTYTPEFDTTVIIQPDGFVTLKVGKPVELAGKTVEQAKVLLERSASERLLHPAVSLNLLDFQRPYFVVAGEVYTPTKFDLRSDLTVIQGLMIAGGVKQTGKSSQVVLIRGFTSANPEVHLIDVKHLDSQKVLAADMPLNSGDVIFVPRNRLTRAIQVFSLITSPAIYANIAAYTLR